jgi:hypothetical protein
MNDVSIKLTVVPLQDRHREGNRHLELHFSQPLLREGEFRTITPGPDALKHIDECTPLMQHILRELFGGEPIGVNRAIIGPDYLIIDHYAALTRERLSDIFEDAAVLENMAYEASFGS